MNEIVNTFLQRRVKFISEMHSKQPGFTYSACSPFVKNKEKMRKFMEAGNTRYIYWNYLDKVCFPYDMAHGKYKGLPKRTESCKF